MNKLLLLPLAALSIGFTSTSFADCDPGEARGVLWVRDANGDPWICETCLTPFTDEGQHGSCSPYEPDEQ